MNIEENSIAAASAISMEGAPSNADLFLAEPFPKSMLRFHQGKKLTYVPVAEVIARLNRVLGTENWSSQVISMWREGDHPDWVMAHVRVTATINGISTSRDGVGGQQIKKLRSGNGVVDLGDEYKGAMSDAFKKACQGFGVGLELARTDEALNAEESYHSPTNDVTASPASGANAMANAVSGETWKAFESQMKSLSKDEKAAVREWWGATYSAYGNPSADLSTEDMIVAALEEMSKISLAVSTTA